MNAFAVMPCTCSPASVVITVTPVANMPSVRRNSTDGSESGAGTALEQLRLGDVVER